MLAGIARSKRAPEGARVLAANSLLDRGWGKPDQHVVGEDGGAVRVIIRHIIENAGENEPVVIDNEVSGLAICDR